MNVIILSAPADVSVQTTAPSSTVTALSIEYASSNPPDTPPQLVLILANAQEVFIPLFSYNADVPAATSVSTNRHALAYPESQSVGTVAHVAYIALLSWSLK